MWLFDTAFWETFRVVFQRFMSDLVFTKTCKEFRFVENATPDISDIESELSLQRVKELGEGLIATSNILDTLDAKTFRKQLRTLAGRLRTGWEDAYRPFKVKTIGGGPRGRKRIK